MPRKKKDKPRLPNAIPFRTLPCLHENPCPFFFCNLYVDDLTGQQPVTEGWFSRLGGVIWPCFFFFPLLAAAQLSYLLQLGPA